jgi:thiol-disulfide isomerase/thioredoxin
VVSIDESAMNLEDESVFLDIVFVSPTFLRVGSELRRKSDFPVNRARTSCIGQVLWDSETLVLFWNPGCGFCQQMLPDLKEWEENPPEGAPKLLVVSAGTQESNKAMGLSSSVVLDQGFEAGRAFGARGTPSAILVDAKGKIASEVAVGAPGVLKLATLKCKRKERGGLP